MSIIQEALKKAQSTYTKEVVKTDPPQKPEIKVIDPVVQKPHHAPAPFNKLVPGVILLVLIAGFGLSSFFSKKPAEAPRDSSYQSVSYRPAVQDTALKDSFETGLAAQAQVMAAPIKSAISPGAAFAHAPDLELNGIMYLEERPRAIINGNMVEVGESVNGARIDAINRDSVLLNCNDLEITLKLKE